MVIDTLALLLLALGLLTVPLNWLLSALAAAVVHELCHYLALRLLGGESRGFAIRPGGAVLSVAGLTPGAELLCALAGPLGALLLLPLYRLFPRAAICAAFQSAFNLLPIRPLDGGRVLRGILFRLMGPDRGERICRLADRVTALLMAGAGLWLVLHGGSFTLLLFSLGVLFVGE